MGDVRVLSLWQPWATLIMLGVKTIETRSWPFPSTVPLPARILIHASAKRLPRCPRCDGGGMIPPGDYCQECGGNGEHPLREDFTDAELPLGAVLGWVTVTDSLPMIEADDEVPTAWMPHLCPNRRDDGWSHWKGRSNIYNDSTGRYQWAKEDISGQLPYGDFTPGRFGWLLDDPAQFPEPIPARGHQGLWRADADLLARVPVEVNTAAGLVGGVQAEEQQ